MTPPPPRGAIRVRHIDPVVTRVELRDFPAEANVDEPGSTSDVEQNRLEAILGREEGTLRADLDSGPRKAGRRDAPVFLAGERPSVDDLVSPSSGQIQRVELTSGVAPPTCGRSPSCGC